MLTQCVCCILCILWYLAIFTSYLLSSTGTWIILMSFILMCWIGMTQLLPVLMLFLWYFLGCPLWLLDYSVSLNWSLMFCMCSIQTPSEFGNAWHASESSDNAMCLLQLCIVYHVMLTWPWSWCLTRRMQWCYMYSMCLWYRCKLMFLNVCFRFSFHSVLHSPVIFIFPFIHLNIFYFWCFHRFHSQLNLHISISSCRSFSLSLPGRNIHFTMYKNVLIHCLILSHSCSFLHIIKIKHYNGSLLFVWRNYVVVSQYHTAIHSNWFNASWWFHYPFVYQIWFYVHDLTNHWF